MERRLSDEVLLSGLFATQVATDIEAEAEIQRIAKEAARDHLAERLVTDGFFPNLYQVEQQGTIPAWRTQLKYGYPWNLPSRLFKFPAHTYRGPDGVRRIAVLHPLLFDHPLIVELRAKGYELVSAEECLNGHGVSANYTHHGTWWHAVDLIHAHPRELIDTRKFTTDADIAGAVRYRCSYPHEKGPLTRLLAEMREVMADLGVAEPEDGSVATLATFEEPISLSNDGNGKKSRPRWPINTISALGSGDAIEVAWAYIHGIERGWFQNDGGYLHWSPKGRAWWTEAHPACDTPPRNVSDTAGTVSTKASEHSTPNAPGMSHPLEGVSVDS